MKNNRDKALGVLGALAAAGALMFPSSAQAVSIGVDQILADQPTGLSGTVDMTLSGNVLTITLVNTSAAGSASGANGLLSGLAFNLPGYSGAVDIIGGSVILGPGSSFVNSPVGDLSKEWGFQNSNAPGHFNGLAVDTVVATMEADTTTKFAGGNITLPDVLDGPEYGLVRTGGNAGGLSAVQNSVVVTLTLSKTIAPGDYATYLGRINSGLVAIEFGSPTGAVPDGGSTLVLLGSALTALGYVASRRKATIQS